LCHYTIWPVFTSAPDLFRKIWSPDRMHELPMSSLASLLGFLIQGQLGKLIGFPSHLIQQWQPSAPVVPAYIQLQVMKPAQDLSQYHDSPLINRHYDLSVASVMERIQKLCNGIAVKGKSALVKCPPGFGQKDEGRCIRYHLFNKCAFEKNIAASMVARRQRKIQSHQSR
jgi:hypothetical protein